MVAIFCLVAAGAMLQAAPPATPTPLGQAYYLFLEARQLEGSGDVDGAIAAFHRALELEPGAADIHAELAGLFARQGRAAESVSEARLALSLDADNREAHRILGFVLGTVAEQQRNSAMRDEAIGHFEKALEAGVRDPAAELTLGRLAVRAGKHPLAIQWLTTFLLDQTNYPEAMELLAEAYEGNGQPGEAADEVEALLAETPKEDRLRPWLAELRESASQWTKAASVWQQLAGANPDTELYPMRQAMALINSGDLVAGRDVLRALTAKSPANVRAWYLLSQVERRAGNAAGAMAAAERIRALDADSAFGPLAMAEARLSAGDAAAAVAALEPRVSAARAEDVDSGMYARMASALASALQEAGQADRAVGVLEAATARLPEDAELQFELGAAYDRAERFDAAEKVFRDLISADPTDAEALNYLGYLLADRGEKLDEAISLIGRALDVERDNPSYLDSLGWAHFKRGEFAEAQAPLERAAAALPKTSVIQDHLGDLYVQIKRYRDAVGAFDRALSGDRRGIDATVVNAKRERARALAGGR